MREGADFMVSKRVRKVNLTYIKKRLTECCDKYGGTCEGCPDLEICVRKFDMRCELGTKEAENE